MVSQEKRHPIVLFTPFYKAKNDARQKELDECLLRNISCKSISKVVLIIDDDHTPFAKNQKLEIVRTRSRPTYRQWLDLTRSFAPDAVSLLANSDISFDSSIESVSAIFTSANRFVAISRYEKNGLETAPHSNPHWSQDVWALCGTAPPAPDLLDSLDIPLGVPRCDNKIAYLFAIHGWEIFNPIRFIKCTHHHETLERGYQKRKDTTVLGGVAYVHPCSDLNTPSMVDLEIWSKETSRISKTTLNQSLPKWLRAEVDVLPLARQGANSHGNGFPPLSQLSGTAPTCREVFDCLRAAKPLFQHKSRFKALRQNGSVILVDSLVPRRFLKISESEFTHWNTADFPLPFLAHWIPPVLPTHPIEILDRPRDPEDAFFWQYPCITEKQAYENHRHLAYGSNLDSKTKTIHTYLPLPWATFIDKKKTPDTVPVFFRPRILGLKSLAESCGLKLAVHTVCQSIHWRKLMNLFADLGITDIHISHSEKSIPSEFPKSPFRFHSWPLYAVNVENADRAKGLVMGKPIKEKRYLASFIGAHMKHYRSDIRLRLAELAKKENRSDVLVEVGDVWNFEQIVFNEQVKSIMVPSEAKKASLDSARRYNEILSDSIFSLCPEGAGPNTLRFWESLAVGAIPVVLSDEWHLPEISFEGTRLDEACILYPTHNIDELFSYLRSLKTSHIESMQKRAIRLYKKIKQNKCF
jgi:hypothetical protein